MGDYLGLPSVITEALRGIKSQKEEQQFDSISKTECASLLALKMEDRKNQEQVECKYL